MKKAFILLTTMVVALSATAQSSYDWNRVDTLIGNGYFATAYPLAQKY